MHGSVGHRRGARREGGKVDGLPGARRAADKKRRLESGCFGRLAPAPSGSTELDMKPARRGTIGDYWDANTGVVFCATVSFLALSSMNVTGNRPAYGDKEPRSGKSGCDRRC